MTDDVAILRDVTEMMAKRRQWLESRCPDDYEAAAAPPTHLRNRARRRERAR